MSFVGKLRDRVRQRGGTPKPLPGESKGATPAKRRTPHPDPKGRLSCTPHVLTALIETRDKMPEKARNTKGFEDFIHVSELATMCPRRKVLQFLDGSDDTNQIPRSADRLLWKIGKAVEKHIRDQVIAAMDFKHVWGKWVCPCGDSSYLGEFKPRHICSNCHKEHRTYDEVTVYDANAMIAGHPDLLILLDGKLYVVEIKSMNVNEFERLAAPKPNHAFQAASYQRMLRASKVPMPVASTVITIYGNKDYSFRGGAYKEFHVPVTGKTMQAALDAAWAMAINVKNARRKKSALPKRVRECKTVDSPVAKNCTMCVNCFSRSK